MRHFKLNIGTKLFLLYFIISSTLLWVFAHRTALESAKSVMVEVSSLMSRVASQNNKDGEIAISNRLVQIERSTYWFGPVGGV